MRFYHFALATLCFMPGQVLAREGAQAPKVPQVATVSPSSTIPEVKARYHALSTKLPARTQHFSQGTLSQQAQGLVWQPLNSAEKHLLVSTKQLPAQHVLSDFVVSPDGRKVAYALTRLGQDLKQWFVVSVAAQPQPLLERPIVNRMDDLRWNAQSSGLYYSYWPAKEAVQNGQQSIVECRFRSLSTGRDQRIWDHGLAENFAIADIDSGETLLAYRLLNPAAGIKTTFSLYRGTRADTQKPYHFTPISPRNQYVGVFLGLWKNQALVLSSQAGDHYGIMAITPEGKHQVFVAAQDKAILHTAQLHHEHLILQYHDRDTQHVRVEHWNLNTGEKQRFALSELGLTPFGALSSFDLGPGATRGHAHFEDVRTGTQVLTLDLAKNTLQQEKPTRALDFDHTQMQIERVHFTAKDGTPLAGYMFRRKDRPPAFGFIRHYGFISIKNTPEPREVQMVLEAGGAYLALELPGGGERGSQWFLNGSRHRKETVAYIPEAAHHWADSLGLPTRKIAVLGRSWGGMTSLLLAAQSGDALGPIHAVVPVIDLKGVFENGWFGRISHSDLAPETDAQGDYILDNAFWQRIRQVNPVHQISDMPVHTQLRVFTNGLDDRVDQSESLESRFIARLRARLAPGHFKHYHYDLANHGSRDYQMQVIEGLIQDFDLTYRPLHK